MTEWKDIGDGFLVPAVSPVSEITDKWEKFPLQIQDEEHREHAKNALEMLWNAMELTKRAGYTLHIHPDSKAAAEAHYQAWTSISQMLLGDDSPSMEVLT